MKYKISDIARIIDADETVSSDIAISVIQHDSRKVFDPSASLFFALKGPRRDGHQFISELYQKGVRCFVVQAPINLADYPEAVFLRVADTLAALQALAAWHRRQFEIPVIGITGSNGKTIVKEWLYQLLNDRYNIIRSPKSYNSQIGVPLSVWQMAHNHTLAIFEAGISEQGEMLRLERIIQPTIGILTNIGEAHSEGFIDNDHKFREKMILFRNCRVVIGRDQDFVEREDVIEMLGDNIQLLRWGRNSHCQFFIQEINQSVHSTDIEIHYDSSVARFSIPFTDEASIENAITCCCVLMYMKMEPVDIAARMAKLHTVNMRLELKKGINNCILINDSYSADLSSLEIALGFLDQQAAGTMKTLILSDFLQTSLPNEELYSQVAEKIQRHQVQRVIGIGETISRYLPHYLDEANRSQTVFFPDTERFIDEFRFSHFNKETILVKGARKFRFEKIVQLLEQKAHQTLLEINLSAIVNNLKEYQRILQPSVKVMAMVKAFAYGSGGAEIAGVLQYHKVDYLGVAYADEGVELRNAGITLPIMVMNPDENSFEKIAEYKLEPELYSFPILFSLLNFLKQEGLEQFPVHLELETGMNRLGFAVNEIEKLAEVLAECSLVKVRSVFTHLVAAEEASHDAFTQQQFELFQKLADKLQEKSGYHFLRHIANSAAIVRYPHMQLDMVRLGIGLYGVDSAVSGNLSLQTVATLKSSIAQIKKIKAGESVSYNRKEFVKRDSLIATVRLGYADGYPRRLGNGNGKVWIKGKLAPVMGTVCMDMFMVDVTDIPGVAEGDEVIIFGKELTVQEMAAQAETIAYDIMTGISQRVRRVYYEE